MKVEHDRTLRMPKQSNVDTLTRGKRITARKRALKSRVESVEFNPEKRVDYLTGFSRRKIERKHKAQKKAAERDRQDAILRRAELRKQRKLDLAEFALPQKEEEEEEWTGFEDLKNYEDDMTTTTVTVTPL